MPLRKAGQEDGAMLEHADLPEPIAYQSETLNLATGKVEVTPMAPKVFRTHARVVRSGHVQAGPKQLIPLDTAVVWGLCDEQGYPLPDADYEGCGTRRGGPYIPEGLELRDGPTPDEVKTEDVEEVVFRTEEPSIGAGTAPAKKVGKKAGKLKLKAKGRA